MKRLSLARPRKAAPPSWDAGSATATASPPARVGEFPEVVEAAALLAELRDRLAGVEQQIETLRHAPKPGSQADAARALLDSGELELAPPSLERRRERLTELAVERSVVEGAIRMQRDRLAAARLTASEVLAAALVPEYRGVVAELVAAAARLQAALDREGEFRKKLVATGSVRTGRLKLVESPALPHALKALLREAKQYHGIGS